MIDTKYQKIVIKIGSNVLSKTAGDLDTVTMDKLCKQISYLHKLGIDIVLVSSGAVASGKSLFKPIHPTDDISARQMYAAIGQVKLLSNYYELFNSVHLNCAQVLVTKEDFRDRNHYMNMQNCFQVLLRNKILPIVNENDVISITELMFTDNDELAGLVAGMINADALIILSNIDGIYDGNPALPGSKVIYDIDAVHGKADTFISASRSDFGRGGMLTKYHIARKVCKSGIAVHIANGKNDDILLQITTGQRVGTYFKPLQKSTSLKKRLSFSETFAKGKVHINAGAASALVSSKAVSLLPVGITRIEGDFQKGDIVLIIDNNAKVLGLGKVQYHAKKAMELIGEKNQKPLVHYDYLFLY
ncbi:MAG: glutamate 5-kinase [Cytophagales bacterium]|nr:glutamate 5-kinase [Cytophagales bacterium]